MPIGLSARVATSSSTSMGHRFGISVRAMDSLVRIAIIANRIDYWRFGRTLENLSLEHLSASELVSISIIGIDKKEHPLKVET